MVIQAYVNRGMWIAECECRHAIGLEPCGDAVIEGVKWPQDTTTLRCVCGKTQAIQMPSERAAIEAALDARPVVNRNWYPHETVADLRIENAVHHEELVR